MDPVRVIFVLALVYGLLLLGAYLFQYFFFFHPEKLPRNFRFFYRDDFEEVLLPCKDGNRIDLLVFKHEKPKGVVLYFKGNTKSIKGWSKFRADFMEMGYDFVIFDYPGFGKSTGRHNQNEIFAGSQEVYDYVKERYGEEKIIIYGRSLGSGFAAYVAHKNNPRQLILDSPYTSMESLARYYTVIIPVHWILRIKVPVDEYLSKTRCPVYLIHGTKDRVIPYRFSQKLQKIDPERIHLHSVPGGRHNNLPRFDEYHRILKNILTHTA